MTKLEDELRALAEKADYELAHGLDPRPEIETAAFKGACWANRHTILTALAEVDRLREALEKKAYRVDSAVERMGEAYRPSNGTEGAIFEERFCLQCERMAPYLEDETKADACEISCRALIFDLSDRRYPTEWIEDEHGPRCTAFTPTRKDQTNDPNT